MIEFLGLDYNKEYFELIEAFIPDIKNKGLEVYVEKISDQLSIKIKDQVFQRKIENYFPREKGNIKRAIYKILSKAYNKNLAWGILVGVNPLKLFRRLLAENKENQVRDLLEKGYFLSKDKVDLGMLVIKNQKGYYYVNKNKTSIYVDIPFCPSRCNYCSYPTHLIDVEKMDKYLKALIFEIKELAKKTSLDISNIYIGGGTPSSLGPEGLEKLIKVIKKAFPSYKEFTVEVGRPDTITKDSLEKLKALEIERISINPQSMKDQTLREIGRKHTKTDIITAYNLAKDLGFKNINMDLIIGLPGENDQDFENSLEEVCSLNPHSISIHCLSLKKGSQLGQSDYLGDKNVNFIEKRNKIMEKYGYIPYYLYRQKHIFMNMENIGYCKKSYQSYYNIAMMEDTENIIGFGLASTSKIFINKKLKRYMNSRRLDDYIENIESQVAEKIQLLRSKANET